MSLTQWWPEKIKDIGKTRGYSQHGKDTIDGLLWQSYIEIRMAISDNPAPGTEPPLSMKKFTVAPPHHTREILSLIRQRNELLDLRKQHDWADFWEKARMLLFRILTTAGVSAVILTAYYLGHKWGIPLPLLRIPT